MIQAFAAGYFVWDLAICAANVEIFGVGMLAHAVSALVVFALGFVSSLHIFFATYVRYGSWRDMLNEFQNEHS